MDKVVEKLKINRTLMKISLYIIIFISFTALLTLEYYSVPIHTNNIYIFSKPVPPVYEFIRENNDIKAIVEIPFSDDFSKGEDIKNTTAYMLYSTLHWKPIVNGYSGFLPPVFHKIGDMVKGFPKKNTLNFLAFLGVDTVIVHKDKLSEKDFQEIYQQAEKQTGIKDIKDFGDSILYRIEPHIQKTDLINIKPEVNKYAADKNVVLYFKLSPLNGDIWINECFGKREKFELLWEKDGFVLKNRGYIYLPLFIFSEEPEGFNLSIKTPAEKGKYKVKLRFSDRDIYCINDIELIDACETSLYPDGLKAEYKLISVEDEGNRKLKLTVKTTNTGPSVWLSKTPDVKGEVSLGIRWYDEEGNEILNLADRVYMPCDLPPGESYVFETVISKPDKPGFYKLNAGMVSELVIWFEQIGSEPLIIEQNVI